MMIFMSFTARITTGKYIHIVADKLAMCRRSEQHTAAGRAVPPRPPSPRPSSQQLARARGVRPIVGRPVWDDRVI